MPKKNTATSNVDTIAPIRFKKCPEAMKFIRYDLINLSDIAPESEDAHNSARDGGVDQAAVNVWVQKIKNGEYDTTRWNPPVVVKLARNSEGYRYRLLEGHHRRQAFLQMGNDEPFYVAVVEFRDYGALTAVEWQEIFMLDCNDPTVAEYYSKPCSDADKLKTMRSIAQGMAKRFTDDLTTTQERDLIEVCVKELMQLTNTTTKKFRNAASRYVMEVLDDGATDVKKLMVHHHLKPAVNAMVKEYCDRVGISRKNVITREFTYGDELTSRFDFDQYRPLIREAIIHGRDVLKNRVIVGQLVNNNATKPLDPTEVVQERARKSSYLWECIKQVGREFRWLCVKKNREALRNIKILWVPQLHDDPKQLLTVSAEKVPNGS
jgi:hypothetical protein